MRILLDTHALLWWLTNDSRLSANYRQSIHAGAYSVNHRDPFHRILAAQAELEQVPLVTADPAFRDFSIRCLW
ncbi:type II toxin-antitoxin system VapC family toxin [Thioalkalivibrio sulfidiphilus]|uniref:type II toxin-antitoxin system VapC family toxin n=1 Tax=Thioalkalivibrio sulfidiphilus TaxID=1033854 RepID=UPI000381ADC7|nr:hypothetical protein [Thioalkalivibrio sulfidiphilus]